MPGPVEAGGAAAQVAPLGVGAAVAAGVLGRGALVDVLAAEPVLLEVEPGGAGAAEAAQRVVAVGASAHIAALALVLICAANTGARPPPHVNQQL